MEVKYLYELVNKLGKAKKDIDDLYKKYSNMLNEWEEETIERDPIDEEYRYPRDWYRD